MKNMLTILWLDDMRDPNKYFDKNAGNSNTFQRNKAYYDNLRQQYNLNFVWVKNIEEFISYIMKNGVPEFVSFDHDLGKGLPKGLDCAKWLIDYCNNNGVKMPRFFVHSANPNGQREINGLLQQTIKITESDIRKIVRRVVDKLLEESTQRYN